MSRRPFSVTSIGVTGSPGTGKKSVAEYLSKLTGFQVLSINEYAIQHRLGRWVQGEFVVTPSRLRGKIDTTNRIIVGHLLPYVFSDKEVDFVAILRCSPNELRRRYRKRSYSESKIRENLEAEMLDIIAAKSLQSFGRRRVAEFDTTRTKSAKTTAERILQTSQGKRKSHFGTIANWSSNAAKSPQRLFRVVTSGDLPSR